MRVVGEPKIMPRESMYPIIRYLGFGYYSTGSGQVYDFFGTWTLLGYSLKMARTGLYCAYASSLWFRV